MKEKFKRLDIHKVPIRHDLIISTVAGLVIKCILRYLLMAAYLYACNEFGLYNYGIVSKIVVALTSICLSRWIIREIGRIFWGDKLDDPAFEEVGIVSCIRGIERISNRW